MSGAISADGAAASSMATAAEPSRSPHTLVGYVVAVGLVAAATIVAFVVDQLIAAPNLTLIFVLPVILAATSFGWAPALSAAAESVLVFDFLFTEPRYSFRISSPTDMWDAALLLVIAAIVSMVAAQARRRSIEARLAADRAEALHDLARRVVEDAPAAAIAEGAAAALSRIFKAPAVVLVERADRLEPLALAGGATLSAADAEAAAWTLANQVSTRGENFPFDTASFDFWPIRRATGPRFVLGVGLAEGREDRPVNPASYVELVGAYLAAGVAQEPLPAH